MNRAALEPIRRGGVRDRERARVRVIGSQAILGQYPHAPESLLVSIEGDVYPRHSPGRSDLNRRRDR